MSEQNTASISNIRFDPTGTAKIDLVNPRNGIELKDKSGNVAYIEIVGPDSPEAKKHEKRVTNHRLDLQAKMKGKGKIDADLVEDEKIRKLVDITKGGYLVDFGGNPIPFEWTRANIEALYRDPGLGWIREQVEDGHEDRTRFSPASPTT